MLTHATGYAARSLGFVAASGGRPVLVRDIAQACGIPAPYLSKIINALARADIVTTQRGVGGGVTLKQPATEISLNDLCVALDDPVLEDRCMLGSEPCSSQRCCPAHVFNQSMREKLLAYLNSTTIADIAAHRSSLTWTAPQTLNTAS